MTNDVLNTIDSCVSGTKAVKDLESFSEKVSKINNPGASLKKLKSIIDSSAFSHLSAGLSAVSAILGIISMFSGEK